MARAKQKSKTKKKTAESLFQTVACPSCGGKAFTVVRAGRFPKNLSEEFLQKAYRSSSDQKLFEQVVRCDQCNLVYLSPRLKPELIIDSYAQGEDTSFIAQDAMRIRTFKKALSQLMKVHRLKKSKKTTILDIGSAGGAFLRAAKELGVSAIGIEPNRWMSEYAAREYGVDARAGVLSDHHFPDNNFDMVTLWDVIEHVPSPQSELTEIERILKPGGLLVVNYPDFSSFPARLLGKKWPFWLSVHLTYYTPKTIRAQLEKSGFMVESIKPHWQTLELGYVFGRMVPYFGLAKLPKKLVEVIGISHWPMTYWIGQTEVIARKK